jgi:uncharacterized membrane protein (UPF0127 family)
VPAPPTSPQRLRRVADGAIVSEPLTLGTSFGQRFRGLMGRASLHPGEGLYLPDTSIHMMFMRFAIDALFVGPEEPDGSRSVVATREHLPPWRGLVLPVRGARGVVELAAGTLAANGVRPGDRVVIEASPSEALA